jgi:hypothetical protein
MGGVDVWIEAGATAPLGRPAARHWGFGPSGTEYLPFVTRKIA